MMRVITYSSFSDFNDRYAQGVRWDLPLFPSTFALPQTIAVTWTAIHALSRNLGKLHLTTYFA